MSEQMAVPVLVVDDEQAVRRFLRNTLAQHGFEVYDVGTAEEALSAVLHVRPRLLIVDLGLPGLDGVELTRMLREWSQLPILVLSVRADENDKVAALEAGADDYLTKPFGIRELVARMRVLLRRAGGAESQPVFRTGDLVIDRAKRTVACSGSEVQLTPTEYEILGVLVDNAGKVLTHRQLLREVWGVTTGDDVHMLRVNIHNLRRKLEPEAARPRYIVTEPGVGYRLRVE